MKTSKFLMSEDSEILLMGRLKKKINVLNNT